MSKSITNNGLTEKQQAFVDAYAGDVEQASVIAGLSYQYCRSLLMDPTSPNIEPGALLVQAAIRARQDTERRATIANRCERQELWTKFARDEELSPTERMRASELLGKSEGDFIDKHVIDTTEGADRFIDALRGRKQITSDVIENPPEATETRVSSN